MDFSLLHTTSFTKCAQSSTEDLQLLNYIYLYDSAVILGVVGPVMLDDIHKLIDISLSICWLNDPVV